MLVLGDLGALACDGGTACAWWGRFAADVEAASARLVTLLPAARARLPACLESRVEVVTPVEGANLRVEFRLPLYHESHTCHADASVVNSTVTAGNRVTVQTRFNSLSDVERRAIQQFVRDLRYLRGELSE